MQTTLQKLFAVVAKSLRFQTSYFISAVVFEKRKRFDEKPIGKALTNIYTKAQENLQVTFWTIQILFFSSVLQKKIIDIFREVAVSKSIEH